MGDFFYFSAFFLLENWLKTLLFMYPFNNDAFITFLEDWNWKLYFNCIFSGIPQILNVSIHYNLLNVTFNVTLGVLLVYRGLKPNFFPRWSIRLHLDSLKAWYDKISFFENTGDQLSEQLFLNSTDAGAILCLGVILFRMTFVSWQ